jgi:HSP20 family protein
MAMCKVSSSLHFTKSSHSSSGQETAAGTYWVPSTDVYLMDGGSAIVIKVELAGMRREDLELTVEGNRLKISGQRPDGCRPAKCSFLMMEINYGAFESVIELPEGYDVTEAKAAYQNGFLRIDVPQQKRPASKNISVLVSDE